VTRSSQTRRGVLGLVLLASACGENHRGAVPQGAATAPPPSAAPTAGVPAAEAADSAASAPSGSSGTGGKDTVPLTAQVTLAGRITSFAGPGECHYTADASIYQVPASQWAARFASDTGAFRSLNLTLWQPRGASDVQLALSVTVAGATHSISTVKGGELRGTGRGVIEPGGAGGTLKVDGRDPEGQPVALTVQCSRFTEPVAEGG
jgi:hypothetical protein